MKTQITFLLTLFLISCSTITKKDCEKNMKELGFLHGKNGSAQKFTDELRVTCHHSTPNIDLESYESGFYQGWTEYCLPHRAFEMGKRSDRYVSFCPVDREALFREKYLLGKRHYELKDLEEEITGKMEELKPNIDNDANDFNEYTKLQQDLEKNKRELQAIEVEATKNSLIFSNPL